MTFALALACAGAILAVLHLELNLFAPSPRDALRVLMYHRIGSPPDRETVAPQELERQIRWLLANGYQPIALSQLLAHRERSAPLPPAPVLLTFDDGTLDQHQALLPILRRCGVPAAIFVIAGQVGRVADYGGRSTRFLDVPMLRELTASGVEIGLHTFSHADLSRASTRQVEEEVERSLRFFAENGIPTQPVLAYPFGAYPRDPARQAPFFEALRRSGIRLAFRIGNRLNALPLATAYEVQRTEVRGLDRPWAFAVKVRKGRRKAFA